MVNQITGKLRNMHPLYVHIAIFFALFVGLGFNFGIEGDDIFTLSEILRDRMDLAAADRQYLDIARARHFLQWALSHIYILLGKSQILEQWLFISLWTIVNPVLLFLLLKKFAKKEVALIGAVFFLVYAGKFEVTTTISGGLYNFVILIFIVILHVIFSKLKLATKIAAVLILYFVSFHIYEILLPTTILVPIYFWYESFIQRIKLSRKDILLSLVPVYFAIMHLIIIGTSENPMWNRSGGSLGIVELFALIPGAFIGSINTFVGQRHLSIVVDNLHAIPQLIALNVGVSSVVSVAIFMFISFVLFIKVSLVPNSEKDFPFESKKLVFLGLGLFLIFISPLVSIPIFKGAGFVPSRFTYLPALGMVFIFLVVLEQRSRLRTYVFGALISTWILFEAISMRGILFQYSESARLDSHLRTSISAYKLSLRPKDTLFVSMYENGMMHRVLKQAPYKFENGSAQSLLILDNPDLLFDDRSFPLHERLLFRNHLRRIGEDELTGLLPLVTSFPDLHRVFPFVLTQGEILCGVTKITILNKNKDVLFSEMTGIEITDKKLCFTEATVENVHLRDEMVEAPDMVYIYSGGDSSLIIKGELFHGDGPLVSSAVRPDTGEVLSSKSLAVPGKFTWTIPLGTQPYPYEIKLTNKKQDQYSGRALWKVHELYSSSEVK